MKATAIAVGVLLALAEAAWLGYVGYHILREPECKIVWQASSTDQAGNTHMTSNCDPDQETP